MSDRGSSRTCKHGYTLIEVIASMVGASTLVIGLSTAVFVSLRAVDDSDSPTAAALDGSAALNELLADLEYSLTFTERSANAIAFSVPDRDGDSNPETIRYAWSGTPGDPLTREYNGGTPVTFVSNVHEFSNDLPGAQNNLLQNPGMEFGVTNWEATAGSDIQSRSSPTYAGSGTLYAWRDTPTDISGARQDVSASLVSGTTYEISAWMRKWTATAPDNVQLQLRVTSSVEGEQLFTSDPLTLNTAGYSFLKSKVTPNWTGTLTSAYFEATGTSNVPDLLIDETSLSVESTSHQVINISLQIGSDSQSLIHAGRRLLNEPL